MTNIMDLFTFVFPALLVYLAFRLIIIRKSKINFAKEFFLLTFATYIFALIFIVWIKGGMPSEYLRYNYIPFKTILNYLDFHSIQISLLNIIGNLLITAPLGFYAVFQIRLFKNINIIFYALIISMSIEMVQLLLFLFGMGARTIDIDDVILNTAGCTAGYYITKFLYLKFTNNSELKSNERGM